MMFQIEAFRTAAIGAMMDSLFLSSESNFSMFLANIQGLLGQIAKNVAYHDVGLLNELRDG